METETAFGIVSVIAVIVLAGYYAAQYEGNAMKFNNNASVPGGNVPAGQGSATQVTLSASEVAKHGTAQDCWIIIEGKVYSVTNYLYVHPGGGGIIVPYCGADATQAFVTKDGRGAHSQRAVQELSSLYVGELNAQASIQAASGANQAVANATPSTASNGYGQRGFLDD